jgi:putative ABC transport system permease protein
MTTLRQVIRRFARTATGTALAVVSLGLAVGGAGALLSVFNALVLRSTGFAQPDRLVSVAPMNGNAIFGIPETTLNELARRQTTLDGLCGFSRSSLEVDVNGVRTQHENEAVTGNCYAMLGVRPWLGRLIDEHDAPATGPAAPVAVVSHSFWTSVLAGDNNVVGKTMSVHGTPLTIIGVLPPDVGGFDADQAPDFVEPLATQARFFNHPVPLALYGVGRLRDGVTLTQVDADLRRVWPDAWAATNPVAPGQAPSRAGRAEALHVDFIGKGLSVARERYAQPVAVLLSLAVLLLVLACVNVGGLLLARAAARDRELSVMTALGASQRQLAADLLLEGALVGLAGAAVAVPIAWSTSRLFATLTWTGTLPMSMRTSPDAWVYAAIGATMLVAAVVITLPGLAFVRLNRGHAPSGERSVTTAGRWRRGLIVGQVSLLVILLFTAGLFARSLQALRALDPGYRASGLLWSRLELPSGTPTTIDQGAYFRPLLSQLASIPGVSGAAIASLFPTTQVRHVVGLTPMKRPDLPDAPEVGGNNDFVSPGFFATIGDPVLRGREFDWSDTPGHPEVAIINRALAEKLFPEGDAIGSHLRIGTTGVTTIVGVVGNASSGDPRIRDLPTAYQAIFQEPRYANSAVLTLRAQESTGTADAIRRVVETAGRHRVPAIKTIDQETDVFWLRERTLAWISGTFAMMSLLIGAIGLYALLDHAVASRARELGIRMALGASNASVLRLILREGFVLVATGGAIGAPIALVAGKAAQSLLSGLSPYDAASMATALSALGTAGLAAALWPALRASHTVVSDALRAR